MILYFVHDYRYEYVNRGFGELVHRGCNYTRWDGLNFTGVNKGYVFTIGVF